MKCPNCGTDNLDEATVCISCGVIFDEFNRSSDLFESAKANSVNQSVIDATFCDVKEEKKRREKQKLLFWRLTKSILLVGVALIAFVTVLSFLINQYLLNRKANAEKSFTEAVTCYEALQFDCAESNLEQAKKYGYDQRKIDNLYINIFESSAMGSYSENKYANAVEEANKCIEINPNDEDCMEIICNSKLSLSEQLIDAGEWRDAIEKLDEVILQCQDNADAKQLQNEIFRRWIQEEKAKGNYDLASQIELEWNARYPTMEK